MDVDAHARALIELAQMYNSSSESADHALSLTQDNFLMLSKSSEPTGVILISNSAAEGNKNIKKATHSSFI